MAKNKIITSQGNVQFTNAKGKTISMHPMHCYAVYQDDTVSFLFIYMKEYSGQAFFASQFEDLEVDGETYDSIDALKEAIAEAFAKAGAQARTEIVDELPETGYTNTIYLVKKEHGEGYDEYIYNEDEGWQLIGDTDIEFERYLEKTEFYDYSAATEVKIDYISGAVDDNASDIQFLSGAVDTEISDREAADAVISGAVDTLSTNLSNEVSRAQNAESQLQNNINTVNSRVDAEQIARANADNAISGAVDSVASDLASEVSRAEGAESALDSKIDGEISDREAADTAISGAVDSLSANLSLEVQRAQNAESALNSKVNALSGEVETMGDEAIVDAAYVSSSTTIDFYNASGDVVAQVDATDFIKDGMIEDVRIENGYLIIDFNTESGIQDIEIPLTDIFDPDNYYDKTAVDALLANKQDTLIAGENITISGNVISSSGGGVDSGAVESIIEDYMTTDVNENGVEYVWNINNKLGDLTIYGNNNYGWVNASMMEPEVNIVPRYDSNVDGSFGFNNSRISSEIASKLNIQSGTSYGGNFILLIKSEYADTIPSEYKDDNNKCWIKLNQPITSETLTNDVVDGGIYINTGIIESGIVGWSEVSGNTYHALMVGASFSSYNTIHKFNFNRFSMGQQAAISLTGKFDEIPSYMTAYGQYIGFNVVLDNNWQQTSILTPLKSSDAANSFTSTTGKTIFNFAEEKTYTIEDLMADSALSTTSKNPVQNKVITTALNGKQDTLVSGTNIKTINNTSILGSGNIDIQGGGGVNVVQTTGTSTTDVMSQNAVTTALNNKQNSGNYWNLDADPKRLTEAASIINHNSQVSAIKIYGYDLNGWNFDNLYEFKYINGNPIFRNKYGSYVDPESYGNLSLVETSAITTSVTSASTDSQVPSAKAVYDALQEGGGSITIDPTLDSGSTNAVANSAITNAINSKQDKGYYFGDVGYDSTNKQALFYSGLFVQGRLSMYDKNDTDTLLGGKADSSRLGGLSLVKLTSAEYESLTNKDSNTLYIISD